jgi:hypothetical protein
MLLIMINKLINLFLFRDEITPRYGWSIFALDDRVNLSRQVTEEQRKQALQLH